MLDPWRPGWFRLAAVALVVAVVLIWYAALRRRVGPEALALGALVWLAVLAAVLAAFAPGGSYLAAWPALAGAVTGVLADAHRPRAWSGLAAALVGGAVAVVVLAPTVALFFPALGLSVRRRAGRRRDDARRRAAARRSSCSSRDGHAEGRGRLAAAAVPVLAVVVAVACAGVGLAVDRFDADHPVPSQLVYALDTDTDQAWWASTEDEPGRVHRPLRLRAGRAARRLPVPGRRGRGLGSRRARRPAGAGGGDASRTPWSARAGRSPCGSPRSGPGCGC